MLLVSRISRFQTTTPPSDPSKIDRPDYCMRTSELVNLAYFFLFTSLALMWGLPSRSRIKAVWIGGAGVGLTVMASAAAQWLMPYAANVLRDWLPALLTLLAYWQSGCFFQKANPKLQPAL